jgi:3-hydroxyacyl-CoA dehydrogenase
MMAAINSTTDLTIRGDIAILTLDSPPVNALSAAVREGVKTGVETASAGGSVKAIILICAGRTFVAGADIAEFDQEPRTPHLSDVLLAIDCANKPVIAAMHGTALGGGFELALTANYRIAVPSAKFGLPEIKLGLIPGAGGTQLLPRLVGVERALDLTLSGTTFSARDARDWGVVDELAEEGHLLDGAIAFARKLIDAAAPLRRVRDLTSNVEAARARPDIFDAIREANARKFRGFEAWERAIASVRNAVDLPFDEGVAEERQMFLALKAGRQSKAQRHIFFAERQASKIPDIPPTEAIRSIDSVGIVGAGTMGGGIAMNFLNAGIPVMIVDATREALDRGLNTVRRNYEKTAKKGRLSIADVDARISKLAGSLDWSGFAEVDLVIEAAFEDMALKKEIFAKLDAIAKPGALLATNTSYLDVDEIAEVTKRPQDVLGLHFFSPANVMRLLEIVRAAKTSKTAIATAMQLAGRISKIGVVVGVCHGFVGNRMLAVRQRQATKLLLEGAMPWDVDRVLVEFGFPMGPFAMSDLAGLDIGWSKATSTRSTIREILCEEGRRGQKTGGGYYDYDDARHAKPSPAVERIVRDFASARGPAARSVSDQDVLDRCILPMINEGAKILAEGKALRASDIDVVWINGYGWPVYRGGPMFYAETIGFDHVLARLKALQATDGDDFKSSPWLEEMARGGKSW